MTPRSLTLTIVTCFLLAGSSLAQLTANDPTASLTFLGVTASFVDPVDHDIPIGAGSGAILNIEVSSGANVHAGLAMLGSLVDVTSPVLSLPWGDSIDLGVIDPATNFPGSVFLVADGIGFSVNPLVDALSQTDATGSYHTSTPTNAGMDGLQIGVQFIVQDVTAPPFFLNNTEAASLNFTTAGGFSSTSYTLGDDDSVTHSLMSPILFGGQSYSMLHINSNSSVTFTSATTTYSIPMTDFFDGFNQSTPGVAVALTDMNGNSAGIYKVTEYGGGLVRVDFQNMYYYNNDQPAGDYSVSFGFSGPGSVDFDFTNLLPDNTGGADNAIIGCTNGLSTVGTSTDLTPAVIDNTGFQTATAMGSYQSPGDQDSVGEMTSNALPLAKPLITFIETGTFNWMIL